MTITDLKGVLLARQANLQKLYQDRADAVVLAEAAVITARKAADITSGALHSVQEDLGELEKVILSQAGKSPASAAH